MRASSCASIDPVENLQDEVVDLSGSSISFLTVNSTRAIRTGLIDEGDPVLAKCTARFARITNWFEDGEGIMLQHAIDQLRGCEFILVNDGDRVAIFRSRNQIVTDDAGE